MSSNIAFLYQQKMGAKKRAKVLSKEPSTEDANASELAANGGGGPVQSTIHQVMKMI